ncbi:hypothetical protein QO206_03320 [Leeuwenhoekiella aequorea]|uniref:hypothetical protein n=1 Tax=Leeuwenhoekiella aequorea TaxID=283736 RepID=UPI00352E0000|tara:strand:- start:16198 stop:16605 length:408 start_codon:yes stop_codon:yes gene_type:complete
MVTRDDFKSHLYAEILNAVDRGDEDILNDGIAAAEAEAMGYLSRYDVDTLFAEQGEDRDNKLLLSIKDITVWHFIVLGNPATDVQLRKTRRDEAIAWLKDIQSGKVVPRGWPPAIEEGVDQLFHISSAPKRPTRW